MNKKLLYKKKASENRKVALERIRILFKEANAQFSKDRKLSDRYVALARKISMKYKVKLPSALKKQFCRHCKSYLMPSKNCRVRLAKKRVIYYCLECRHHMRFPYVREIKERRRKGRKKK